MNSSAFRGRFWGITGSKKLKKNNTDCVDVFSLLSYFIRKNQKYYLRIGKKTKDIVLIFSSLTIYLIDRITTANFEKICSQFLFRSFEPVTVFS